MNHTPDDPQMRAKLLRWHDTGFSTPLQGDLLEWLLTHYPEAINLRVNQEKLPFWRQELRPREAAAILGVSTGMVYLLMREGKLRSRTLVRNGYQRGIRLIRRSDVEAL
jgi:hypothetical protein